MGLSIYADGRGNTTLGCVFDDRDASFLRMCQSAPWESLRRGVMQHGMTRFNRLQLERLVEELTALPSGQPAVVDEVIKLAQLAIRNSGSLRFMGD